MLAKNTKTMLVKKLVVARSDKDRASFLAADTTLLCSAIIYTKQRELKTRLLGERIISSVMKSHNIGEVRTLNFIKDIKLSEFKDLKSFMLRLQPYKELKTWIEDIK